MSSHRLQISLLLLLLIIVFGTVGHTVIEHMKPLDVLICIGKKSDIVRMAQALLEVSVPASA